MSIDSGSIDPNIDVDPNISMLVEPFMCRIENMLREIWEKFRRNLTRHIRNQ